MKKYEYKWVSNNSIEELNKHAQNGWRVISTSYSAGGNILSIFLEREKDLCK